MSLSDAVLEIADQMEVEAEGLVSNAADYAMRAFARQLRSAVKASSGEPVRPEMSWIPGQSNPLREALQRQAQEELTNAAPRIRAEEAVGDQGIKMCLLHGGPFDGDTVPIPLDMPVNARTAISNAVYELKEGNELHYSEEATVKYLKTLLHS